MDRETTPTPLLGAQSGTPVIQGTGSLGFLIEHASQQGSGQEAIQHALVRNKFIYIKAFSIEEFMLLQTADCDVYR